MCMFIRSARRAHPVPSPFTTMRSSRSSNATCPDIRSLKSRERGSDPCTIATPLGLPEAGEPDVYGDEQLHPDDVRDADRHEKTARYVADDERDDHARGRDALLEPRILDERIGLHRVAGDLEKADPPQERHAGPDPNEKRVVRSRRRELVDVPVIREERRKRDGEVEHPTDAVDPPRPPEDGIHALPPRRSFCHRGASAARSLTLHCSARSTDVSVSPAAASARDHDASASASSSWRE